MPVRGGATQVPERHLWEVKMSGMDEQERGFWTVYFG